MAEKSPRRLSISVELSVKQNLVQRNLVPASDFIVLY